MSWKSWYKQEYWVLSIDLFAGQVPTERDDTSRLPSLLNFYVILSFMSSSLPTWVFHRLHCHLSFMSSALPTWVFCRLFCQLEFSAVFTADFSILLSSLPTLVFCRFPYQLEFSVVFTANFIFLSSSLPTTHPWLCWTWELRTPWTQPEFQNCHIFYWLCFSIDFNRAYCFSSPWFHGFASM